MNEKPMTSYFAPKNVTAWYETISKHSKHGQFEKALKSYHEMRALNITPDVYTYIAVLKACAGIGNLTQGRQIHSEICQRRLDLNVMLGNAIIHMYGKCERLEQAKTMFMNIPMQDVASWNVLISGCIHNEKYQEAFQLFYKMQEEGLNPDNVTYSTILKACSKSTDLDQGKKIHGSLVQSGLHWDTFLWNSLMEMYVKWGSFADCCALFNKSFKKDVVSWNIMIQGWAQQRNIAQALLYLSKMEQVDGFKPDKFTFASILKGCSRTGRLQEGKLIHAKLLESHIQQDTLISNTLIDMYISCGSLQDAKAVFDSLPNPNLVSWNTMIAGCTKLGHGDEALKIFDQMARSRLKPDKMTYISVLKACSCTSNLMKGKLVHAQLVQERLQWNVYIGSSLVNMYLKCGSLDEAQKVFDEMPERNIVSWNTMIAGYVQHGLPNEALQLYAEMQRKGLKPTENTYPSVLKACGMLKDLNQGKLVYSHIINCQLDYDAFIGSSLIDMYIKCGSLPRACIAFQKVLHRTVVVYNVMIGGYTQYGQSGKSLHLFKNMQLEGIKPDIVTYVSVLRACASGELLDEGKSIHAQLIECGLASDLWVGSSLIDMYAKCGNLDEARKVFDNMQRQDVVSWTALIAGCGQHGLGQEALHLFKIMQNEGLKPDHITLVCVLSACSHAGLSNEVRQLFQQLCESSGSHQNVQHFACMVDLLGRAENLYEANNLIKK